MKYVVLVYCDSPTNAKCLSEANGCTRVYSDKNDADADAKKANDANGVGFARVVAV